MPRAFLQQPQAQPAAQAYEDDQEGEFEVSIFKEDEVELSQCVGRGANAEVYHGRLYGVDVAVKALFLRMGPREHERIQREINVMSKITHPNLVRLYGVTLNPLQVITGWCAGGDCFNLLHTQINNVQLGWDQLHKMSSDVAAGMAYLHARNPLIIHRDLKSPNLMLDLPVTGPTDCPQVKVTDFGLSKMRYEQSPDACNEMTTQVGSVNWMAPEAISSTNYDERVDIYSFGMVMFEIICREVPFEDAEDHEDLKNQIVSGQRPDLEAVPPDTPPLLRNLMIACWAADPDQRPDFRQICSTLRGPRKAK